MGAACAETFDAAGMYRQTVTDSRDFQASEEMAAYAAKRVTKPRELCASTESSQHVSDPYRLEHEPYGDSEELDEPPATSETSGGIPDSDRNPKDIAGDAKAPLHLVPSAFVHQIAAVLGHGAAKYGAWNWRDKKPATSAYMAASLRHLFAWFDGQDTDPESGFTHLAHAAATLAIIMDAIACGNVVDDRPTKPR